MRTLTERLRSGFGGIVPPLCDEAANKIDELESSMRELLASCGPFIPAENLPTTRVMWTERYLSAVDRARNLLANAEPTHIAIVDPKYADPGCAVDGGVSMDDVVYERTKEQRDYWKDRAENLLATANRLHALIDRIDRRMGKGWTAKLADALTPDSGEAKS